MSSAPSLQRIAQAVRQIGEQHRQLADELDELGRRGGLRPASRSELLEMVRALLTELGVLAPSPAPSPSPSSPTPTTPTRPTRPREDPMPILFRDFAYAHARVAMKGDDIAVERGTGFERIAFLATKLPEPVCKDPIQAPIARPPVPAQLPRNTQLVRLRLSADHQIDADEMVAIAVPADRETAYRYEVTAIPVGDDRTIDVAVRAVEPDTNAPLTVARFHVLLLRVA